MTNPIKVLEVFVVSAFAAGELPTSQWTVTIEVYPQTHSGPSTREPFFYTGLDVNVGDYVTSLDGVALEITEISSVNNVYDQTYKVVCMVEDVSQYNAFRDPSGNGVGLFTVPGPGIIFSLNELGLPLIDPMPREVAADFFPNLLSRFQSTEEVSFDQRFIRYAQASMPTTTGSASFGIVNGTVLRTTLVLGTAYISNSIIQVGTSSNNNLIVSSPSSDNAYSDTSIDANTAGTYIVEHVVSVNANVAVYTTGAGGTGTVILSWVSNGS